MNHFIKIILFFLVFFTTLFFISCNREQLCDCNQIGALEVLDIPFTLGGQYNIKARFRSNQQNPDFDDVLYIYGKLPKEYKDPGTYNVAVRLKAKNICGDYHPCNSYIYKIECIQNTN